MSYCRTKGIIAAAALFGALTATGAHADKIPRFEAGGTIQSVDSMRSSVVVNGDRYPLSQNLEVHGVKDGRFELKVGQRISYKIDTGLAEPTITEISVHNASDH